MIGLAQQPVFSQNGGFTFDFGFDFDFSNTNFNTTNFNINVNIGNSFNFGDFDLVGTNPCPGCPGENINNFTFTTNSSFDNAVANEILINRAIEAGNTAWYTEQQELIRQHLAEIFNTPFASFNDAKDALFLHSEQGNITRNSAEPISRYSSLESQGYGVSRGYLRELKLIQIRRAEIDAGNLNNPQYGYLSIDTTAIRDITDLETLDLRWNTLKTPLEENIINTHRYKYTLEKLQNLGAHFDTEVVELKNSYYNSFDFWEKINYMQFLINYEEIKRLTSAPYYYPELIQLFNKFSETDKATSEVIEAYALEHRDGGDSIFANPCTYNIQTGREFTALEISSCMEAKRIAFNNLVNNTSTEYFAIENLIAELDITDTDQKNWLFAHATEASLMVAFLDANRVNGVATAQAKSFSMAAIEALMNGAEVDFENAYIETSTPDDGFQYTGNTELIPNPLVLANGTEISISFGTTKSDNQNSNKLVSIDLINGLKFAIEQANNNLTPSNKINSIYIAATTNGTHSATSNHNYGTAIDISRINGKKMALTGITNQIIEIQKSFDNFQYVRENFGPYFKHKFYKENNIWNYNYPIGGHKDHIHFSVRK